MIRGTFASPRLRNQLRPGTEGGVTLHLPDGEPTTIYEAASRYAAEGTLSDGFEPEMVEGAFRPKG